MNAEFHPVGSPAGLLIAGAADTERVWLSYEDAEGRIREMTYAEALARARRAAGIFAAAGLKAGDRVHLHLPNCIEFYDAWFAASLLGAAMVPTNPRAPAVEIAPLLADAEPGLGITTADLASAVQIARPEMPLITIEELAVASPSGADVTWHEPSVNDLAAILYTSGTSGRAKGVMVTNANYSYVGEGLASYLDIRAEDRWLVVLPLFHANAQYYTTMSALSRGASIALVPRFSASLWGRQVKAHGVTMGSLAATPVRMILASPPCPEDADNKLRFTLFGQNVTDEQAAEFERRFDTPLIQLYGMTETILPPTMNPLSDERRWQSIGRPMPGVTIRLVDEDGAPAAVGAPGEILVGGTPGQTLAAGYFNMPEETVQAFGEGWLRTGDLATRDADGFLYFLERAKDIVKRGGENLSVTEIEAVIAAHPDVAEVAAVGVPDPIRDEAVVAAIVLEPGHQPLSHEALVEWCGKSLAPFKIPSGFAYVDSLPRTSIGKLNRREVRDLPAVASVAAEIAQLQPPTKTSSDNFRAGGTSSIKEHI